MFAAAATPPETSSLTAGRQKPKLPDRLRESLYSRHCSRRTDQSHCQRVRRFSYFHSIWHQAEMAEPKSNAFRRHLAMGMAPEPFRDASVIRLRRRYH